MMGPAVPSSSLADLLASLDSSKIQQQIEQLEKTRAEVAAGLKESAEKQKDIEDKVKWVESEKAKMKEHRARHDETGKMLFHLKRECEEKEKKALEDSALAEKLLSDAKAKAEAMEKEALAKKMEAEALLERASSDSKIAAVLKQKYEDKLELLKSLIKEG